MAHTLSIEAYLLAAFDSRSYWNSTMFGTAAPNGGWLHSDHSSPLSASTPCYFFHTSHTGLLKGEWVLLITPWLYSWWINLWMVRRESQLVQYCHVHTAIVTGICCSSICSNPTTDGSSESPGKTDSSLIISVSNAAISQVHQHPFGSLK